MDVNYDAVDGSGEPGRAERWLSVSFNLFYPAFISVVLLMILSRYIHLPLGEEISAYLDHMFKAIERTVQTVVGFVL